MSCCTQVDTCNNSPRIISCFNRQEEYPALRDALGPFPDEVIMTAIDHILYYSGATKIFHLMDLVTASIPSLPIPPSVKENCTIDGSATSNIDLSKRASLTSLGKYFTPKSQASLKPSTGNCTTPKSSSFRSVKCTTRPTNQRLRTPRVDFSNPVCDNRQVAGGPTISDRMKHSLTACSTAFQRLKSKLAGGKQKQMLWTRLVPSTHGCQIYEVYRNADKSQASSKFSNRKQPVLFFLVMPNGTVMPFETITSFLRI